MIVNRNSHLGGIASAMLNKFIKRSIFVAAETPDYETWDLYRKSARNSVLDGGYMLLENTPRVISSVVNGEDTLHVAFLHRNIETAPPVVPASDNTEEEGETSDNVQDMDFDHGLSY